MKVNPYYSKKPQDVHVFHDDRNCEVGSAIPAENKKFGTNGYPHCPQCAALAGK
jgi:hypothetical protein